MANKTLEYRDGAVTLKGYLADDGRPGARPGVVLFPEATGVGDHVIERARRLAALAWRLTRTEMAGRHKTYPRRSSS